MQNKLDQPLHAGFFVRLAAYLLDSLIVGAALLVVRIPFWIASWANPENILVKDLVFTYSISDIVLYVLGVLYFIILTYKTGATIGKKVMHLRVESAEDRPLTLWEVCFRETVGRFLSSFIANIGYIMIGIHNEKRGLHDLLSDTVVVYDHLKKEQAVAVSTTVDSGEYKPATYGQVSEVEVVEPEAEEAEVVEEISKAETVEENTMEITEDVVEEKSEE